MSPRNPADAQRAGGAALAPGRRVRRSGWGVSGDHSPSDVVSLRWEPPPEPRRAGPDELRRAILETLAESRRRWTYREMLRAVWCARHLAGARDLTGADFRVLIDRLVDDGLVVEAWEFAGHRNQPRHLLVAAERWAETEFGHLVEVRGRADVLRRLGLE